MKKKSLTTNYLYNVAYKILTLITPFITTPYVSRVLGVTNIGIYNYTYSILSYFILFGVLGLQMYGQREIAYYSEEPDNRTKVFWEIFITRFINILIVSIVYLIFAFISKYKIYYLIFLFELFASAIDISWLYYGIEEFKLITIRNFIIKIVGILSIFIFVKTTDDLLIYILCHAVILFIGNASLWLGIKKYVTVVSIDISNIIKHIKYAAIFFIPQCLDSIYMLMDKVMLGHMTNMDQVGIYSQADKIIKMVVTIITSLGLVVSPRIAQAFKKKDEEQIKNLMLNSFSFVFTLAFPAIFGLISISKSFSIWFFGTGYESVDVIISSLSIIILFMGLNSIMGWQYLMTVKREKDFTISVFIGALCNLLLNIIFIRYLDSLGAVIASIISMLVMTLINYHFIKEFISLSDIRKLLIKPIFSSLVMFAIIFPASLYLENNVFSTLLQMIIGGTIYLVLMYLLKDKIVYSFYGKIKKKYLAG